MSKLKEIKKRLEATTSGRWAKDDCFIHWGDETDPTMAAIVTVSREHGIQLDQSEQSDKNATFIANSKDDITWLIKELERRIMLYEGVKEQRDWWINYSEDLEKELGRE